MNVLSHTYGSLFADLLNRALERDKYGHAFLGRKLYGASVWKTEVRPARTELSSQAAYYEERFTISRLPFCQAQRQGPGMIFHPSHSALILACVSLR